MNLGQALQHAQTLGVERLDAQWLLLHAVGRQARERAWLLAHDDWPLSPEQVTAFEGYLLQRLDQVPLAYLTSHTFFFGLHLHIDRRVLDPRADTETLVRWSLDCVRKLHSPSIADLGTGSGAVALALAHCRPDAHVWATDISSDALNVATQNAQRLGLPVAFSQGDWLSALDGRTFDLLVSNPPYVAINDPHLSNLKHEPLGALVSGPMGRDDIEQIVQQAPTYLRPHGWLLLEHGHEQGPWLESLLLSRGWQSVQSRFDEAGIWRCTGGHRATMK